MIGWATPERPCQPSSFYLSGRCGVSHGDLAGGLQPFPNLYEVGEIEGASNWRNFGSSPGQAAEYGHFSPHCYYNAGLPYLTKSM